MGKKAFIAATTMSLVLILLLAERVAEVVECNPIPNPNPPTTPITEPSKITIYSPTNNSARYSARHLHSFNKAPHMTVESSKMNKIVTVFNLL
jgi:hypothetical protein